MATEYEPRKIYTGTCIGGPLDGQQCETRYVDGFIIVSKESDESGHWWCYELHAPGIYRCDNSGGTTCPNVADFTEVIADGTTFDVHTLGENGGQHV